MRKSGEQAGGEADVYLGEDGRPVVDEGVVATQGQGHEQERTDAHRNREGSCKQGLGEGLIFF